MFDPVQSLYAAFFESVPRWSLCLGPLVVTLVAEVLLNGFFMYLDLAQPPSMMKYRIDYAGKTRPLPSRSEVFHALKIMCYTYIRLILPFQFLSIWGNLAGYIKEPFSVEPEDLTTWLWLRDSILCILLADVWNYWMHRLMHVPFFWSRFHRLHHEYTYTFVFVNHAFHDFEIVLFGLSVVFPPILLKTHVFVSWFHIAFTIMHTGYQHSGYYFPWLGTTSPLFHDAHHYLVSKNFASHTPWLDMLFGTYAANTKPERDRCKVRSDHEVKPRPFCFSFGKTALSLGTPEPK